MAVYQVDKQNGVHFLYESKVIIKIVLNFPFVLTLIFYVSLFDNTKNSKYQRSYAALFQFNVALE